MLMGKVKAEWQNTVYVARMFHEHLPTARRRYKDFVQKATDGNRDDLVGGGLIRSAGGWTAVKALRKANAFQKGDERIFGDSDFVDSVISEVKEANERKYRLRAKGLDFDDIANSRLFT